MSQEKVDCMRLALGIPSHVRVVGNIGRIECRKDPISFLNAAALINKELDDVWFLWVGDGPMRLAMERRARELDLHKRLVITGLRPPVEIPFFLKLMSVFLFTSRIEGVPLCILEAQAAGIPVVTSSYRGVREIITHQRTGYIFDLGCAKEASCYVLDVLRHPFEHQDVTKAAAEAFSTNHDDPEKMAEDYRKIYHSVARKDCS